MAKNRAFTSVSEQEKRLDRVLVAIRQNYVFLLPPLDLLLFGKKSWSLSPSELAVLSLLSEFGKPVVAEELGMDLDTLEKTVSAIYSKLEIMTKLTLGSLN